jgi:hypothetical protein
MDMFLSWITVVASACLFVLPFLATPYGAWLSCFSLVPLFYEAFHDRLTFSKGFVWGSAIIFLHSGALLHAVFLMSSASILVKSSIAGALIGYAGLHVAMLWWLSNKLCHYCMRYLPGYHVSICFIVWTISFWLFFLWLGSCFFWIFIRCEGYALISPIVPLVQYAQVLKLVGIFGYRGLLALLLCWQAGIGLILTHSAFVIAICFSGILLTTMLIINALSCTSHRPPPDWLSRVAHLPRSIAQDVCCSYAAKTMLRYLDALLACDPDIDIIVIPEDGFQTTRLLSTSMSSQCIPTYDRRPIHVFLGAYRAQKKQQYNTLYWFYNGHLISSFDKRHTMIFTEKTPSVLGLPVLDHIDRDTISFAPGDNKRPIFEIAPDIMATPYLCSELFFNDTPDDQHGEVTVFAFCSDKWACARYIKDLMYLLVRLRAAQWQRDIVYISYQHGVYVTKEGEVYLLKDFSHPLQKVDDLVTQQQAEREKTIQRNAKTYSALEQYSVKNLGNIIGSCCMSLLLPEQAPYNGFSFFLTNSYKDEESVIKIMVNREKLSEQENMFHAYLLSDFEIYYLDTITTPTTIQSLSVTVEPDGTVYLGDLTTHQSIIASRYR